MNGGGGMAVYLGRADDLAHETWRPQGRSLRGALERALQPIHAAGGGLLAAASCNGGCDCERKGRREAERRQPGNLRRLLVFAVGQDGHGQGC